MLVITRKIGETIVIGDCIKVTIADVQKGKVKIAIDAPKEVSIFRQEIIEEVKAANIEASVDNDTVDLNAMAKEIMNRGK